MAAARRQDYKDLLDVMQLDDSSSEGSSSSDEDLDFLFLEAAFPEPRLLGPRLNMEDISEIDCEQMFRFQKQDMDRLLEALQIPDSYTSHQGSVFTGMESLMILLRRLSYPNRWCDLVRIFGRTEPELSMAFDMITNDLYARFSPRLTSLDLVWLNPGLFSDAIHRKGAPLEQVWGFIDGTARPTARPIRHQRIMYSGHKRVHCLKFQGRDNSLEKSY
ncbi:uncharacterized protein [Montipora foliosa]|uniref:uncharacterized protein isoform X2 n=1 Tax=Montipora foliosa TaxID=591990 RepID=UPI0035F12A1A